MGGEAFYSQTVNKDLHCCLEVHVAVVKSVMNPQRYPLQQTQNDGNGPSPLLSWLYRGRREALTAKELLRLSKTGATLRPRKGVHSLCLSLETHTSL